MVGIVLVLGIVLGIVWVLVSGLFSNFGLVGLVSVSVLGFGLVFEVGSSNHQVT